MDEQRNAMQHPDIVWIVVEVIGKDLHATARLGPAAGLQQLGWNVTMLAPGDETQRRTVRGFQLQTLSRPDVYFIRKLWFHLQVIRYLFHHWKETDVVFFQHPSMLWLTPVILLRRLLRQPAPLFVMDTRTLPMSVATGRAKVRAWFNRWMYGLGRRWADGHTVITPQMAQATGLADDQVWGVWPSGVDVERFASARSARVWPADGEPVRLVYAGTLRAERNLATICRAVIAANRAGMRFTFTVVGSGPQQEELQAIAAQSDGHVRVLLPVPHEEVPQVLAQAHVGVLPFPDTLEFRVSSFIKLFEYLAAGLPMLATDIIAHTDVIGDGDYVFWTYGSAEASFVEALHRCWDGREELPAMGERSAAMAPAWSWTAAAGKLDSALRGGMARRGLTPVEAPGKQVIEATSGYRQAQ